MKHEVKKEITIFLELSREEYLTMLCSVAISSGINVEKHASNKYPEEELADLQKMYNKLLELKESL